MWIIDKDKTWNNLYLELLFYFYNIKVVPFKVSIWDWRECKHSFNKEVRNFCLPVLTNILRSFRQMDIDYRTS